MKTKILLLALLALSFASCRKDSFIQTLDTTVTLSNSPKDVWTVTGTKGSENAKDAVQLYDVYYFFDAAGKLYCSGHKRAGNSLVCTHRFAVSNYSVYCFTNVTQGNHINSSSPLDTTIAQQTISIDYLADISLGSTSLPVVASQFQYSVDVPVGHILAKLAVAIDDMPADIQSVRLVLPSLSHRFHLDGTFAAADTSLAFDLAKAQAANTDGTYDWSLPETLIFPTATGAAATYIDIVITDNSNTSYTYHTSTSTLCSTGTRTALSTTGQTLRQSLNAGFTQSPWTTTIQQGTFTL